MSTPRAGWNDLIFMLRVADAPPVNYQRKNILWETPLPDHSHGAPIIVGDRVFVTSEPDELICIDKHTGKILWIATNNYYDATPQAERDANPALQGRRSSRWPNSSAEEKDPAKRWAARKNLYDALIEIDKKKYTMQVRRPPPGALRDRRLHATRPPATASTSTSGTGSGVAACYDLDGKRQLDPPPRREEALLFRGARGHRRQAGGLFHADVRARRQDRPDRLGAARSGQDRGLAPVRRGSPA